MVILQKNILVYFFLFLVCVDLPAHESYFKPTFELADRQFVNVVESNKKAFYAIQTKSYPHITDKNLNTRTVLIKLKPKSKFLIVVISGTHGVEGYVGSALQSWLIDQKLSKSPMSEADFLFLHALNPVGFKYNRRTDQDNIDLNRNFLIDPKDFSSTNENYKKINDFLNPPTIGGPVKFFDKTLFIFKSIGQIVLNGYSTLRNSILIGQYEFERGLFFGGFRYQNQKNIIDDIISEYFSNYRGVVVLDLHTGYGETNKMHILSVADSDKKKKEISNFFQSDIEFVNKSKDFYKAKGDLMSYMASFEKPNMEVNGVVFEFGTMNSQTVLGSIESLRRMVLENQFYYRPSFQDSDNEQVQKLFLDMFNPQDENFRKSAVRQFENKFDLLMNYLNKL